MFSLVLPSKSVSFSIASNKADSSFSSSPNPNSSFTLLNTPATTSLKSVGKPTVRKSVKGLKNSAMLSPIPLNISGKSSKRKLLRSSNTFGIPSVYIFVTFSKDSCIPSTSNHSKLKNSPSLLTVSLIRLIPSPNFSTVHIIPVPIAFATLPTNSITPEKKLTKVVTLT